MLSRFLLPALLLLVLVSPRITAAEERIRFARTPDISPDGKQVAFSYQGDIWVVDAEGGMARAITSHPAHDLYPVFSPDGQRIAFSSTRHGGYDLYVVSVRGGRPRRITFHEASDVVRDWTPDGKQLLFASSRDPGFPSDWQLYTIPAEGGRTRWRTVAGGKEGTFSPKGDLLAYSRGPGSWYRQGYRGSANDEIWIARADGTHNHRLTTFAGRDASPMWSPDGKWIYYVSEFHGTPANLVRLPRPACEALSADRKAAAEPRPEQLTFHKQAVRLARISGDGAWIVYECGTDLCLLSTRPGSKPRTLAIQAYADYKSNPETVKTFTSQATEYDLAPGEKHVAFAVHGKLFVMPISSRNEVKQLTQGASNDHGIAWAPDGARLLFLSDRHGQEDVYALEADDPDHPKFLEAHRYKVHPLTNTPQTEIGLSFSPDGKRVAFIRSGQLVTMQPDGKGEKVVVAKRHVIDYEWSPDSRWLVYARRDPSFASELYIIPAGGATADQPARNITRYATFNAGVTWSANGEKLAFLTDRRGDANLYVMDLEKPAAEGFKESGSGSRLRVSIDWEDLHLRAQAAVPQAVSAAAISPDGSEVAFRDEKTKDLWVGSTSGNTLTRLTTGSVEPRQIRWSRRKIGSSYLRLIYFLDGKGNVHLVRPGSSSGDRAKVAKLSFKLQMRLRTKETYEEMFEQGWRHLAEHFYDPKYHGANWDAVRDKYRPVVAHIAMKEDLYSLLYLMMGELNASHLGVSGSGTTPDQRTGELGLLFDDTYEGPGLKIKEVLKRGPADRRGLDVRVGDVIVAIDDHDLKPDTDIDRLLNGKVNEVVALELSTDPSKGKRRQVEIKATSRRTIASLMYERWVAGNAARVRELSKGKLGYIHIPSMNETGLDHFVRSLYSDCFDKEAILIDVRYNSGGFTHDRVLNYLGGKGHTIFRQREGGQGLVLRSADRKWTKPAVVLINNRSFSDAEIFPSAFRTLGYGKLVGEASGGKVIGTTVVRLVDGSRFRIPRTGVYTAEGVNMEREGVQPDVLVVPHPDDLAAGKDVQLETAVQVLSKEVVAWKAKKTNGKGP